MTSELTRANTDKLVCRIQCAGRGDLVLDFDGHLCARAFCDANGNPHPSDRYVPGERLATMTAHGWKLTPRGAAYFFEHGLWRDLTRAELRKLDALQRT